MENESNKNGKRKPAVLVRLSEQQRQHIENDVGVTGESAASLLRDWYFSKPPLHTRMSKEEVKALKALKAQLDRVGNKVNNVARKVNCGFQEGWSDELREVRVMLHSILTSLISKYGEAKNNR